MSKLKHFFKIQEDTVLGVEVFHVTDMDGKPRGLLTTEQDAKLFCEAATIQFDNGLTMSELLRQRERMAELLHEAMGIVDNHALEGHPHWWGEADRLVETVFAEAKAKKQQEAA